MKLTTTELERLKRIASSSYLWSERDDLRALIDHIAAQEREITDLRSEVAAWEKYVAEIENTQENMT